MYCPKCNLHSEEYVDKCPLCDGPMEVDEVASGVMKTPTLPEKESTEDLPGEESLEVAKEEDQEGPDMDATMTLEADQAKILAEVEQQRAQLEESEGREEAAQAPPPPQEEERPLEEKETSFEDVSPPTPEPSGRGRLPLFLGGGILIILILAVLGYFLFAPSEKPSKPDKPKAVVAKKKADRAESSAPRKKAAAKKRKKKKAAAKSKKQKKTAALAPVEKVEPAGTGKTDGGTPAQKAEPSQPMAESKEPLLPATKPEEAPPAKVAAVEPEAATADRKSPQPVAAKTESKEPVAEPPEPSPTLLPSSTEEGSYSVHVGSFRTEQNASLLRDKLKAKGYPAFCKAAKVADKGEWYRVQIGYFATREDVNRVEAKLKNEEKIYTRILKR